ncbi:MAG TPA: hybrid sensor histidine kinase/response regulator [Chloroflexota bacterium]|nr:hybrid sensor histidine kinase/response regulator [Chloroflexota bacterium]
MNKTSVLIVDDNTTNLSLLFEALQAAGYHVIVAQDGVSALERLQYTRPDIILLDIMMPGLDGYETLRHIKAHPAHQGTPVIFMTAVHDTHYEVKGLEMGAVDYLTKPLHMELVLARLHTHLTIRSLQKNLQEQNADLEAYAHTVAHDLKGPLAVILGHTELIADELAARGLDDLTEQFALVQSNVQKQINIVNELLLLASLRKEEVQPTRLNMAEIVAQAQHQLAHMVAEYGAEIVMPTTWPQAVGHAPWVEEVWTNYLSNGLKYGGQPPRLTIDGATQPDGMVRFWVQDNGRGLTPTDQSALFTEFTRLNQTRAQGYGLGLSIVRRIIYKLGGEVGAESEMGQGSTFYFTLPGTGIE